MPTSAILCIAAVMALHTIGGRYIYSYVPYEQWLGALGLPLLLYDARQLLPFEPLLSHRSAVAHAHSGCWGVAESAALAMASQHLGTAKLRVTRQVLGPATLALACGR